MIACWCWTAAFICWPCAPGRGSRCVASWTEQTRQLLMRQGFLLSRPSYDGHHWLRWFWVIPTPPVHTCSNWLG